MSETITLLDYTQYSTTPTNQQKYISPENLKQLRNLQKTLTRPTHLLLDLGDEKDRDEDGSGMIQLFQNIGDNAIQTQKYVGALSLGETRVTINSRFDGEGRYFMQYLLEHCWNISSLLLPTGLEDTRQFSIYDWFLVCRLAMQLQAAWKKGTFRAYRSAEFYDSRVRGQLDIPRHIRLNMGLDDGRAAYRNREYSPDNPYNRLLLYAFHTAEKEYPSLVRRLLRTFPECRSALVSLRRQLPGWELDRPQVLLEKTRRKITHPVFRGYETARLTARAILRRMGQDLLGDSEAAGILLDMDKLWEELLAKTLLAGIPGVERQETFDILGKHRDVRPDFLLPSIVLDAKYRRAWGDTLNEDALIRADGTKQHWNKYVQEDIFQVLSYMYLLDRPTGAVVFPVIQSAPASRFPISGLREDQHFWRLPFRIPWETKSYQQFREEMQAQTDSLRTQLFGEDTEGAHPLAAAL